MKVCSVCGVQKPLEGFYKNKSKKDGHRNDCKECNSKRCKENHKKNRKERLEKQKKYYKKNKEVLKVKKHQDYMKNKEKYNLMSKTWYKNNYDYALKIQRRNGKKYYQRTKHLQKRIEKRREYENQRYKDDETYRLIKKIRSRTRECIHTKSASTQKLTGCTWKYFKQWIESQMTDTMQLDTIHIDHMMPLKSFDLTKPEEQRKACHYTNLQPMLPSENMSKGSKIVYDMKWNGQQWEINRSGAYLPRDKELI